MQLYHIKAWKLPEVLLVSHPFSPYHKSLPNHKKESCYISTIPSKNLSSSISSVPIAASNPPTVTPQLDDIMLGPTTLFLPPTHLLNRAITVQSLKADSKLFTMIHERLCSSLISSLPTTVSFLDQTEKGQHWGKNLPYLAYPLICLPSEYLHTFCAYKTCPLRLAVIRYPQAWFV